MSFLVGILLGAAAVAGFFLFRQKRVDGTGRRPTDRPEPYAEMAIVEGSLGFWEFEAKTFRVTGNRRHMEFWGFPATGSSYSMRTVWSHLDEGDRRPVRAAFIQALSDGQPFEIEFGVRTTTGRRRILWIEGHVSRGADGTARSIFGLSRDRTEERALEDRLREERHQLAFTLRVGGIGAWTYDPATETHTWDEAGAALLQWGPGARQLAPHRWFLDHLHADDRRQFDADLLARRLTGKKDYEGRIRFQPDTGEMRIIRMVGRFVEDESGGHPHFRGVLLDMTEEIAEREASRRDKERLTLALEVGGVGTWEYHPARGVDVWDAPTFAMFGRPFDPDQTEVPHDFVQSHFEPEDLPQIEAAMDRCGAAGSGEFEVRLRLNGADGMKRFIRSVGRYVPENDGQPAYFYGVHWDHTKFYAQRRELELAKTRLELALGATGLGTWQVDPKTMTAQVDERGAAILAHSDAPAGRPFPVRNTFMHPAHAKKNLTALRAALKTGEVLALETRAVQGDGRTIWLKARGRAVPGEDGRTVLLGTLEDITAARATAERLEQALVAAQSADRAKSAFLASMSHEIRTPLNAIIGFAQVLSRNEEVPPRARRQIHTINEAGRHLLELLDEVLDLSKIEAGAMKLEPGPTDLRRLIDETVRLFEARAQRKGLRLTFRFPQFPFPPLMVDAGKIRQVVQNLIGNAIKFTSEGSVLVELEDLPAQSREAFAVGDPVPVIIRVIDTGPGMSEEEQARLFDPFVQGEAGRRVQAGSGLGLTISKKVTQLLGGDLTVESRKGRGSTFTVQFSPPLAAHAPDPLRAVRPPVKHLKTADDGITVLVVDDNSSNRSVLHDLLTDVGFAIIESGDGRTALELWKEQRYPIILMDLVMPEMDGYEVIRQIRAMPGGKEITILAVSASTGPEGPSLSEEAGADGFIQKPVRADVLFDLLEDCGAVFFEREDPATVGLTRNPFAPSLNTLQTQVQQLPEKDRDELRRLVEALNFDAVERCVRALNPLSPALREHLLAAVERFDHDHLLSLLRS